nr:unnamed protein product [Spirometra erinaceieuropaei]
MLGVALREDDGVEFATGHRLTDLDYADDIALLALSFGGLQFMVSRVNEVVKSVGLSINAGKTKVLSSCIPDQEKTPLGIDGCRLEEVDSFKYLVVRLLPSGQSKADIVFRIDAARWVFSNLRKCRLDLSIVTKICVYRASVRSVLLYDCKCWALRVEDERKLETDAVPPELPASAPPNHYVCADWGVATPSAKMTSSSNLTARLESYVLVPVLRHRRWINLPPSTDRTASGMEVVPSGGRVLYVGPAGSSPFHPKATTTPRSHLRSRPVGADGEVLAENQDDCVCLQMDILLPESRTAKLTVRFGPISQSVALPWLEGTWRPDERKITATTTTTSMFASLVAGIIWPFAFGTGESVRSSTTDHQLPHPPANQWLHLRLPITTRLFPTAFDTTEVNTPPPTPTAFSLHGVAGVCLDDVALLATKSADCPRSLTWTIASSDNSSTNEILFFNDHGQPLRRASPSLSSGQQRQSGSVGDRVVGGGEATVHVYGSTSRRRGLLEHLLNGAFLFGILLALIVIFVTVGLAVAVACGKRASRNAVDSLRKKKTTFLRETTVLRSPSVCSMPTFAISPIDLPLGSGEQTRSEVCYDRSLSLDSTICSSSVENGLLLDEDSRLPAFRVSSEETSLLDCRSQLRMPSSSSVMINKRRSRRNAPPLTGHSHYLFQSKPAIEPAKRRRPNSSVDCNPALPPNPQPGARLSLLLSINEDSELVLVPQAYNPSNPTSSADGAIHPETVTGQNAIASTTTTLPSEPERHPRKPSDSFTGAAMARPVKKFYSRLSSMSTLSTTSASMRSTSSPGFHLQQSHSSPVGLTTSNCPPQGTGIDATQTQRNGKWSREDGMADKVYESCFDTLALLLPGAIEQP